MLLLGIIGVLVFGTEFANVTCNVSNQSIMKLQGSIDRSLQEQCMLIYLPGYTDKVKVKLVQRTAKNITRTKAR